ncbi:MAG: hypothetical protein RL410_355 [Actinomycetota bacterium]|jgi:competence protein ComEA
MNFTQLRIRYVVISIVAGIALIAAWQWSSQPASYTVIPSTTSSQRVTTSVIVDVAGYVRKPGLVELPIGSRVSDAIEAAGGVLPHHRPEVNLARVLVDGEQIFVGETAGGLGATTSGKLNINRATESAIEDLPGVGPVLAQRIIDYRTAHGSFKRIEDLDNVSGVGPAMMAKLKPLVTVG